MLMSIVLDASIKVNGKTNMKWATQAHAQYVAGEQKIIMSNLEHLIENGLIVWMPLPEPYREEYELATEQMEHDILYEQTYNSEDGSM